MPSPFPGMDPYLEDPEVWPDFHDRLATQISDVLNERLPPPYYARLDMRPDVGVLDADEKDSYVWRIVPDVSGGQTVAGEKRDRSDFENNSVRSTPSHFSKIGPVPVFPLLEAPRTAISESLEITVPSERSKHRFVEVRDPRREHRLVTLIEILSPTNKRPGQDRFLYRQKYDEVFHSDASIIEIDLLREGQRMLHHHCLHQQYAEMDPKPDYLIVVNRGWTRFGATMYQMFAVRLRQMLPCIPVPLREGEPETPLDLQYVMNRVYDTGPYRRGAVDYSRPPVPPLSAADARWAEEVLRSPRTPSVSASGA